MPLLKGRSKETIAYLAGMIDADGCFNIGRCRTTFVPRILIVNTNKGIVDWLKDNFGGDINKSKVKNQPKWKPRYTWRISNKKALQLAEAIYDYLIIKWQQALIFKVWWASQDVFSLHDRKEGYKYLSKKLKKLNRKGVKNAIA